MRLLLSLLLVGVSYAMTSAQDVQQNTALAQISGRVLDGDGKPVRGASVCANSRPAGISGVCAPSRAGGKFTIHMLKPGLEYIVFASKREDYYPFPTPGFYDAPPGTRVKVKLEEGRALQDVEVRLGPKAGRLVGTVINAETNEVLKQFRLLACRDDRPEDCIAAGSGDKTGRFNLLVPTVPFSIKISAPGFEDWYGSESPREQPAALLVGSGTTMELNIFLRPIARVK